MRYTVTSSSEVDGKLALIWLRASDRSSVTAAANKIDALLRTSPGEHGHSFGQLRILRIDPLIVVFSVSRDDCLVKILDYFYVGK